MIVRAEEYRVCIKIDRSLSIGPQSSDGSTFETRTIEGLFYKYKLMALQAK